MTTGNGYGNEHLIMRDVYDHFFGKARNGVIPADLRAPAPVGTVQDDPFNSMIEEELHGAFPDLEIVGSGKLTSPDIVIRDVKTGVMVGVEVKKLTQMPDGADSRGLTMDYNSSLPCGTALIRVGNATADIPCYYLFALLSNDSSGIVTFVLMHGDFINYDFNLHKKARTANRTTYGHGPYGEGSVRNRSMYTYPNPLNHRLRCFHGRKVLVTKKLDCENMGLSDLVTHEISRRDIYGNNFLYSVVSSDPEERTASPEAVEDVFAGCRNRKPKKRAAAAMPSLKARTR